MTEKREGALRIEDREEKPEGDRSVRERPDTPKIVPKNRDLQERLAERYMDFINLAFDKGIDPPAVIELEVDAPGKNLFVSVTPHPDDVFSTIQRLSETANTVKSTWGRGSRARVSRRDHGPRKRHKRKGRK